jgi:hypothetical protein
MRDPRRSGVELIVVDNRAIRDQETGLAEPLVEMTAEKRVEIGIHHVGGRRTTPSAHHAANRV